MGVEITFLGHAGFILDSGSVKVAIDPFLTGNPVATMTAEQVECDHIAVTHGHADHFTDVPAIAKRTGAKVFAPVEICEYLAEHGIENTEPANLGGRINTDFGWVAFTRAHHSSSFNGRYMGPACGVVVHIGGITIYHLGDTDLFADLKMIGELYTPHIAMIPVGDRFTMGPTYGAKAAELIRPAVAIPMHYGTWPLLVDDIAPFKPLEVEVRAMKPGETWKYGN